MSRWSALPPVLAAVLLATLPAARAQDALPPISPAIVLQHSAATDALQVRALMQEGHYQQALGWAAHLSGAHPGQGDGAALYGWLLHLGGSRSTSSRICICM